jgi:hypothetical protein
MHSVVEKSYGKDGKYTISQGDMLSYAKKQKRNRRYQKQDGPTFLYPRTGSSRKVTGSNPDEVTEFLNLPNPSSRTVSLASTQPLTEMGTRNLPGGLRAAGE